MIRTSALATPSAPVAVEIGKGASLDGPNIKDSVIGRYELGFAHHIAGSFYQYGKLHITAGGYAAFDQHPRVCRSGRRSRRAGLE